MTPKFYEEWRTLDPEAPAPESTARLYGNRADAVADEFRFPWRIAQKRLVSYWEDDQMTPTMKEPIPMTDQTIPDVTDEERRIARDWAAFIIRTPVTSMPMEAAAARVILSTIPAPPPPRPTLADMTEDERAACQWMQADVKGRLDRWAITRHFGEGGDVEAVSESGQISWFPPRRVIPRPDLPRMTWPGEQQPAPALPEGWRLADHEKYGRVVVTNTTPDEDGHVYFVAPAPAPLGNDWHPCDPGELTLLDTPAAPPNTLAEGSEWDDADALARACEESGRDQIAVLEHDGWVYVWDATDECWEGSAQPTDAPFTIIHTGFEADQ